MLNRYTAPGTHRHRTHPLVLLVGLMLLLSANAACSAPPAATSGSARGSSPARSDAELAARAASAPRAVLSEIALSKRSDGKGYVVRVRSKNRIQVYGEPRRVSMNEVQWTLYNTELADRVKRAEGKGAVDQYRTVEHGGNVTLHFHLDPEQPVTAAAYRDAASPDLLLAFTYTSQAPPVVADAPAAVPQPSASTTASRTPSSTPHKPSKEAIQAARERWKLDTIVIDAGHGGKDSGARAYGMLEKHLVLGVAKKLGAYIEDNLDINVVYTREDDRFIELEDRGKIANEAGGKLFISIHANAARSRSAYGTETYFLGMHKTEASREVMERENSVIRFEDNPEQYEAYDQQAFVHTALTQSAYMRQSQQLAALIEQQFDERVQRHSRGVRQAGFYVLWSASMPAVLVELGFITNRGEARFLNSEQGQAYMASAIYRAVRDYKAMYEKGIVPPPTGTASSE